MLRDEDIRMERGRASHGGDFLRFTHIPTGISKQHPGPLRNLNQHKLISDWFAEVEAELRAKGLTQYIIPDHRTKHYARKRPRAKG
jgi:hypothetical protein